MACVTALVVIVMLRHGVHYLLFLAAVLLHGSLVWVYYRDALKNPRVPEELRNLWSILVFVFGPYAQLPYYWKFVR